MSEYSLSVSRLSLSHYHCVFYFEDEVNTSCVCDCVSFHIRSIGEIVGQMNGPGNLESVKVNIYTSDNQQCMDPKKVYLC